MSDDPYDFEIALPAAPSNVSRSTKQHRDTIDDDGDVSDVSANFSNMSGLSSDSDNDSERGSANELQQRTELTLKRPAKSTTNSRTTALSSGSALDRAKTFLSKYSNAAAGDPNGSKTPASSRSRRISLDLDDDDDDDFSVESSDDDKGDTTNKKTATSKIAARNEPPQSSENPAVAPMADEMQYNRVGVLRSDEEDESNQSSDRVPAYSVTHRESASPSALVTLDESNSDESHAGDSIESFHSGSSEERTENRAVVATPAAQAAYQEESADDYNDSFHEESLSQMNGIDSHHRNTPPSLARAAFNSVEPQQSIASESGVYEEEVFEKEDLSVAFSASATTAQPIRSTNKSFDYSMDFSDDEVEGQEHLQSEAPPPAVNDQVRRDATPGRAKPRSQSGQSDNGEQSAFLDSESFANLAATVTPAVEQPTTAASEVPVAPAAPIPAQVSDDNSPEHEHAILLNAGFSNTSDKDDQQAPTQKFVGTPPITAAVQNTYSLTAGSGGEAMPAARRPHVTIVRALDLNEDKCVEMKDASTQFTGNHAAIQADLVPDGMHNLFIPAPSAPAATTLRTFCHENEVLPCDAEPGPCRSEQHAPPPPSMSPQLGSSMYSLDALKLPMTTSTSIYKQQILALQEQILQKKRETERIVLDRMAFQYSSLRGTERFIAARRAHKLELWEALMRVDPTLDERKAREVACLAQATST
ncbi:hypothetical protein PHYPSEUDO_011491 [Phytophthora pseudosyringae]|uniref:Uncharacterized protein n=1 Tax=Phytophthora pseudosyringae TaxID=221518 RepID=A0A8T1VB84_9STRA|nr:hypothetical protein PHYPSEUDO_011491 [Phytophthora pseudosyringae]